ncbi:hypothetical protein G7Y29_09185 [Corynebacterium qintianiae]|uniref:Uncharacterized protein n=1 Tax=Corynebacterium qintianiae TaxID=2709392 RepID=A0A7T0KMF0_9CORY|nr:hypothetical protein [Corynebacterium qintianiae]QPK83004.1 hypothetical protein G7Y29_09185 [Corynebacterium qintianiae]
MAHYDLYSSLGLDRAMDSASIAGELDRRINAGAPTNPGGMEELDVARRILGHPGKRGAYDSKLDDPNAPDINIVSLRELARAQWADAGVGSFRPRQYFPETGSAPGATVKPERSTSQRAVWPWLLAAVLLLSAAAGGLWWYTHRGAGERWEGVNQEIHMAFPDIVSAREGLKGWNGLPCAEAAADAGQLGKIRCADADLGVSVIKYDSETARDAALPESTSAHVLSNGQCEVTSVTLEDSSEPAYFLAPKGANSDYGILINGRDAEEQRLALPVCP